MDYKNIYYNNSLLFLSLSDKNFLLTESLINKGFPLNLNHLSRKEKENLTLNEQNKILLSYQQASRAIISDTIEYNQLNLLRLYLSKFTFNQYNMIKYCFYHNNINAFEIFKEALGEQTITSDFYIYTYYIEVIRSHCSKKDKQSLLQYLSKYSINWHNKNNIFTICINHRFNIEQFEFFYKIVKKSISTELPPQKHNNKMRFLLKKAIKSYIFSSFNEKIPVNTELINHILAKKELNIFDDEGKLIFIKESVRFNQKILGDYSHLNQYILKNLCEKPHLLIKITKLKNLNMDFLYFIEKLILNSNLKSELRHKTSNSTLFKI